LNLMRQVRKYAADEEYLSIIGEVAGNNALAEAAIWEQRGRIRVAQQRIEAGPQFGMGQEIKRSFDEPEPHRVALGGEFKATNTVAEAKIGKRSCGGRPQQVIERRCPVLARRIRKEIEIGPDGGAGDVQRSDAEGTSKHLGADKVPIAFVGFRLGDVTDRAKVHLARLLAVSILDCKKFLDRRSGRANANPVSGT
jgi:hypothetical protein